jgi:hypothetical protein
VLADIINALSGSIFGSGLLCKYYWVMQPVYLLIQQPSLVTHPLSLSYKGLSTIGNAFENNTPRIIFFLGAGASTPAGIKLSFCKCF